MYNQQHMQPELSIKITEVAKKTVTQKSEN